MKKPVLLPILTIALAAILLFGASAGLKGVAEKNQWETQLKLMRIVLPNSAEFTEEPYTGDDANIRAVYKAENGFVVKTAVYGYAGDVTMLIGVSNKGNVTGLVVTDLEETFGLGANALTDHRFLSLFLNTDGGVAIGTGADAFSSATGSAVAATETYVDGITGATVTSKAIARSVNSAVAIVTGADTDSGATSWGG